MNIAFIGYGNVGAPLADHLQKLGHTVTLAARDTQSDAVKKVQTRNAQINAAPIEQAVHAADVVFLATPYSANADTIAPLADALAGKIIVDCTNPVGAGLSHGLSSTQSGSEALQALVPRAKVVKAFTIYGFENFENNSYPAYNVKPVMMYCGDDADAKHTIGNSTGNSWILVGCCKHYI